MLLSKASTKYSRKCPKKKKKAGVTVLMRLCVINYNENKTENEKCITT